MEVNSINTLINQYKLRERESSLNKKKTELSQQQKGIIFASSTAGMITTLAACGKVQKLNIFKLNELSKIDIGAKEIITIAGGSIIGGLTAGSIIDKENRREKVREAFQQMVGNVIFPVSFVSIANWLYGKTSISKHIPKVNNRIANAFIQAFPATILTIASLVGGIIVGNKFACKANDKMFNQHENRNIKVTDFAAHVDDVCLGATLVAKNLSRNSTSIVGSIASKLVPPALIVPGYMTGITQEEATD